MPVGYKFGESTCTIIIFITVSVSGYGIYFLHSRAFSQVSQSPRVDVLTYLRYLHVLLAVLLLAETQPPEILVSEPALPPVSHIDVDVVLML